MSAIQLPNNKNPNLEEMTFQVPLYFYFQRKKSQFVIHTCNLLGRIKEHRPFGLRKDTKNLLFSFKDKNTKIKTEFNSRASSLRKKKPTAINFITNHSMVQINRKMAVKFYSCYLVLKFGVGKMVQKSYQFHQVYQHTFSYKK